jgi:ATP-dependent helicase/nuclease subunit B
VRNPLSGGYFRRLSAAINGRFLNPEEAAGRLAEAMRRRPLLAGARVWIDGFSSFSAQELAALDEILRQSSEVDLCLCLDPGVERALDDGFALEEAAGELFAETGRTLRRLRARAAALGVPELEPLALAGMGHNGKGAKENGEARGRFSQAPDLAHLEAQWGRVRPIPWGGPAAREHEPPARAAPPSIRLVEAASPRAEAGAAAREMARCIARRGSLAAHGNYREKHRGTTGDLAPALREFGIPYSWISGARSMRIVVGGA